MQTATVDEIIRAIDEAARTQPGGAVAFDGDGTLWSGDIGEDFFEAALGRGPHEVTRSPLAREAVEAGVEVADGASAHDLAHAIHAAYLAGKFPEERICEIVAWIAGGWTQDDLRAFCKSTVEAIGLRSRLHGEAIRVLRHADSVGIEAYLVSASPLGIVEAAAEVVGIPLERVTAVTERVVNGVVECGVVRPIPYGEGKVTNLRGRIGLGRPLYAAFGDNAFDVALLRSAQNPVAIRPKQRLVERAHEVPGLRILERI